MDCLPLTANGKIDRKALPPISPSVSHSSSPGDDPQGEFEEFLAKAWAEALGLSRIRRHDNFFALGGHSLAALKIAFQSQQEFQVDFPLQMFVQCPMLREQAKRLEDMVMEQADESVLDDLVSEVMQARQGSVAGHVKTKSPSGPADRLREYDSLKPPSKLDGLSPEERTQLASRLSAAKRQAASNKATGLVAVHPDLPNRFQPFPLTDLQQAYLFGRSEGMELGNISCHGYAEVDVDHWDRERFEAALQRMIERHEMLRCIILPEGRQQILSSTPRYQIEVNDLRALDAVTAAARLDSIRARDVPQSPRVGPVASV